MNDLSRRKFLRDAAWALPSAAIAGAAPAELNAQVRAEQNKLKVIVAGGHPGDPEYGCGGTVARYAKEGHAVTLLYLNRGEGGIPGKTGKEAGTIRSAEGAKACQLLKATPLFAGQVDGQSVVDKTHYDNFARIIEGEKPDVLFTQWPIDGHPDHRATSMLCYEAWLRMGKSFALYYYEVSDGEDTLMFFAHRVRGHHQRGANKALRLLCACQPEPRPFLRAAGAGGAVSRRGERSGAGRSVRAPCAEPERAIAVVLIVGSRPWALGFWILAFAGHCCDSCGAGAPAREPLFRLEIFILGWRPSVSGEAQRRTYFSLFGAAHSGALHYFLRHSQGLRPGLRAVSPFGLIGKRFQSGKRVQPGTDFNQEAGSARKQVQSRSEFNQEAFQEKRVQPRTRFNQEEFNQKNRFNR